jgi:hypothetical protein
MARPPELIERRQLHRDQHRMTREGIDDAGADLDPARRGRDGGTRAERARKDVVLRYPKTIEAEAFRRLRLAHVVAGVHVLHHETDLSELEHGYALLRSIEPRRVFSEHHVRQLRRAFTRDLAIAHHTREGQRQSVAPGARREPADLLPTHFGREREGVGRKQNLLGGELEPAADRLGEAAGIANEGQGGEGSSSMGFAPAMP